MGQLFSHASQLPNTNHAAGGDNPDLKPYGERSLRIPTTKLILHLSKLAKHSSVPSSMDCLILLPITWPLKMVSIYERSFSERTTLAGIRKRTSGLT
jgi:hypothetical protein